MELTIYKNKYICLMKLIATKVKIDTYSTYLRSLTTIIVNIVNSSYVRVHILYGVFISMKAITSL